MDGVGEWATTTAWIGNGAEIEPIWKLIFLTQLVCYIQHLPITVVSKSIREYKLWV